MSTTLILGSGYVGSALVAQIPHAVFTHSTQQNVRTLGGIYFRLQDRDSWRSLPPASDIIWTFPAAPLELVRELHETAMQDYKRLLVYGSTSCYLTSEDDETVTESYSVDLSKARVAGEEYLRDQGAMILVLSGIHGPGREPIEWLRQGRIRSLRKRVNLINRDDIVDITCHLLKADHLPTGERVNVSDGFSRRWSQIAEHYSIKVDDDGASAASKIVSNAKLRRLLPDGFQFRRLF